MCLGQAFDVCFVDDAVVVLVPGWSVVSPVEEWVDDHGEHCVAEGVGVVVAGGVVECVGEEGFVSAAEPFDGFGVGVEEEFVGVAAVA